MLQKSGVEISSLIKRGVVSPKEVCSFYLDRIERFDGTTKAFVTVRDREEILKDAEALSKRLREEEVSLLAPLFGLPIAIKDNILVKNIPTTCASNILKNYVAVYDATVVERLKKAGLIIIGKTNLDEFAMGSSTENSVFFPTKNPWDFERVPGGSSGGSAACVSAYLVPLSLGSDTGGSIRQPASFCSVIGLKPTYGSVSRFGLVAFASSLDQVGPFSLYTKDNIELFKIISGFDERDSTSSPAEYCYSEIPLKGKRVGIPKEYFTSDVEKDVANICKSAIEFLEKDFGMIPVEISLPHTEYALSVYYIIASAEASSNLARYDGVKYGLRTDNKSNLIEMYTQIRMRGFGKEVKRRILIGSYVLSSGYYDAYYLRAQKARTLIKRDFEEAFCKVDVIACPVSPTPPFKFGEKTDNPMKMYLSDIFTIPVNLAGLPAISVPAGFSIVNNKKLPVGLQLIANGFNENILFSAASALEQLNLQKIPEYFL